MKAMNRVRQSRSTLLLVALFLALVAGCGSLEMKSHWRSQPLPIDGSTVQWQNLLTKIDDKQVMVALANDSSNLYICMVSDDPGIRHQIAFRGLTLWLDRKGGDDKRFGIHYPLGVQRSVKTPGFISADVPPPEPDMADSSRGFRFPIDTTEMEIIGPAEGEHRTINLADLNDIAVKVTASGGALIYQLKVPLVDRGHEPNAIGAAAGTTIGVGMETGERVQRNPQQREPGERGGFGGGGYGGGRRGRGGFGGGDERSSRFGQQTEPLDVWAKVQLATADTLASR